MIGLVKQAANNDLCVRLYNNKGEHVMSLLPCGVNHAREVINWDLCLPDGKVLYCGIDNELAESFHMGGLHLEER